MPTFQQYLKTLRHHTERALKANLPKKNKNILHQAMAYSVLNGGKRLRPILVYLTGESLGAELQTLDVPACAVEFIHCYSLIHDDLPAMDNDDLRRGKPTCHKAFDEGTAILAGDALQALSFEILARAPHHNPNQRGQMISTLSKACLDMAEGQAVDISNLKLSLRSLSRLHQEKTGALIEASVQLGIIASHCEDKTVENALIGYAKCLGLAFQIQDDILDVEGSTKTLGKKAGIDKSCGKTTFPSLIGLEKSKQKVQQLHEQAILHLHQIAFDQSPLVSLLDFLIQRRN